MAAERSSAEIGRPATLEELAAVLTRESVMWPYPYYAQPAPWNNGDLLDIRQGIGHGQILAAAAAFMVAAAVPLIEKAEAAGIVVPRSNERLGRVSAVGLGIGGSLLASAVAVTMPERFDAAIARIHEITSITDPWDRHGLHGRAMAAPVLMVDDVTDTGTNLMRLYEVAEEEMACPVIGAVVLVDKGEGQAAAALAEMNIELISLFRVDDRYDSPQLVLGG